MTSRSTRRLPSAYSRSIRPVAFTTRQIAHILEVVIVVLGFAPAQQRLDHPPYAGLAQLVGDVDAVRGTGDGRVIEPRGDSLAGRFDGGRRRSRGIDRETSLRDGALGPRCVVVLAHLVTEHAY